VLHRLHAATPCPKSPNSNWASPTARPEIFRLNRDIVSDPDRITPGQILVILPN